MCDTNGKLSKETAQILCYQFQQVFANHGHSDLVNLVSESSDNLSVLQLFAGSTVHKKLCMLNVSKSPGPDAVHPHLLKNPSTAYISEVVLRQLSTERSEVSYCDASVRKKDNKMDPGNYRPVSLTCVACKIMEAIIRD